MSHSFPCMRFPGDCYRTILPPWTRCPGSLKVLSPAAKGTWIVCNVIVLKSGQDDSFLFVSRCGLIYYQVPIQLALRCSGLRCCQKWRSGSLSCPQAFKESLLRVRFTWFGLGVWSSWGNLCNKVRQQILSKTIKRLYNNHLAKKPGNLIQGETSHGGIIELPGYVTNW